jgi:hypothetical protein
MLMLAVNSLLMLIIPVPASTRPLPAISNENAIAMITATNILSHCRVEPFDSKLGYPIATS